MRRWVRLVHKWMGLAIGVQVLLWVSGGLVMSAFPLHLVRGEHLARASAVTPLAAAEIQIPADQVLRHFGDGRVQSLTLRRFLGDPVYDVRTATGAALIDARTGRRLTPLSEDQALRVARADYAGEAAAMVTLVQEPATEIRGRALPLWRVQFDDTLSTSIYISPLTGDVIARRNDVWRLFDFFWMLHIMDYRERSSFNHPLLISAAVIALLLSLSGFVLLFYRVRTSDWRRLVGRR
jgi:uncharacterized iron-regulated membrane protein